MFSFEHPKNYQKRSIRTMDLHHMMCTPSSFDQSLRVAVPSGRFWRQQARGRTRIGAARSRRSLARTAAWRSGTCARPRWTRFRAQRPLRRPCATPDQNAQFSEARVQRIRSVAKFQCCQSVAPQQTKTRSCKLESWWSLRCCQLGMLWVLFGVPNGFRVFSSEYQLSVSIVFGHTHALL